MGTSACDYVIIGGGSAGCVLANRLSADPANRVVLLEAGKPDRHLWLKLPLKFRDLMTAAPFNWGYETEPEPALNNRRVPIPRGKVLGGSSSINGMMYCRCHPSDYDHWRQLGATGWSYADALPYFRRSESYAGGADFYHGGEGELTVARGDRDSLAHKAYVAAGAACGFPVTNDHNGAGAEGFGPADYTIRDGHRASTSKVFLEPAMQRPNLKVITGALVSRIIIEKGRATGVEYLEGNALMTIHADREVILSGGSYNSPQVLMLSGIGPGDHLRAQGITVMHDARDVGRNLQDHVHVGLFYNSEQMRDGVKEFRLDRLALNAARWMLFRTGPLGTLPVACLAYIRSRPELETPDIELLMNRVNPMAQIWFPGLRKPVGGCLGARVVLLHPESRGSVTLRSANPRDKAAIAHNYLSAPNDMINLRNAFRRTRELYQAHPLKGMVQDEFMPGSAVQSDADLDAYIRETASMLFHPTSTCRMGSDPHAVVDPQLRVNGIEGLRVVDASVMPTVPGGHTNAPTIMIAEKAADMILGRAVLPPAELPRAMAAE